jgi:aldose 1-epimerase
MFEYKKGRIGNWEKYTFKHRKAKTGFILVPDRGGLVLEITFEGNQLLDTYTTAEELDALKWSKGALLFPFPNRLKDGRFIWMNRTYTWPINNGATNNAIHGMVREAKFEVISISLSEYMAEVCCRYAYDGSDPAYPFPYTLDMTYSITTNNKFTVGFDVLNRCSHPIPAGFGWHPYFKLAATANDMKMSLAPCQQVGVDSRMLPTGVLTQYNAYQRLTPVGETNLDHCFLADEKKNAYRLTLQGPKQKVTLVSPASGFPYFQVFTPPHRESIALEPMTCNVDALNNHNGIRVIEPGGIWKDKFHLEWRKV